MKEWFLIRDKDESFLMGAKWPKEIQRLSWREDMKARCRERWPNSKVLWVGKRKPATIKDE